MTTRPPVYIALLRGINVGGHRRVGMPALAKVFTELGYEGVQTYIQSGNVVFWAHVVDGAGIEAAIEARFGFPVQVALRTGTEWARTIFGNPYPLQAAADGSKVHLALLSAEPDAEGVASLQAVPRGLDNWHLDGRNLYLDLPNGGGRTRLDHGTLERRLGIQVTVRNWKTVEALGKLLSP